MNTNFSFRIVCSSGSENIVKKNIWMTSALSSLRDYYFDIHGEKLLIINISYELGLTQCIYTYYAQVFLHAKLGKPARSTSTCVHCCSHKWHESFQLLRSIKRTFQKLVFKKNLYTFEIEIPCGLCGKT